MSKRDAVAGAARKLLIAAKAKLADCEDCKDAALMEGEVCSDECAALAAAVAEAELAGLAKLSTDDETSTDLDVECVQCWKLYGTKKCQVLR